MCLMRHQQKVYGFTADQEGVERAGAVISAVCIVLGPSSISWLTIYIVTVSKGEEEIPEARCFREECGRGSAIKTCEIIEHLHGRAE